MNEAGSELSQWDWRALPGLADEVRHGSGLGAARGLRSTADGLRVSCRRRSDWTARCPSRPSSVFTTFHFPETKTNLLVGSSAVAGAPIVGVGAATSLAVALAADRGTRLGGFARGDSIDIYTGAQRASR
jgi:hypothetical protein